MGILNVTADSFSDGGRFLDPRDAVEHALQMVAEGADIIDVGGESTRPGAERIPADQQKQRVLPVLQALGEALPEGVALSIDTTRSEVAAAALDQGAALINDVTAGRDDPALLALAAERDVPVVLMHMQGTPATMQKEPSYTDVVTEVRDFLRQRAEAAEAAGIARGNIILDPGIGFGKTRRHNLELLAALDRIVECGCPVLLGTSRKRFMGAICEVGEFDQLVGATCATTALGVMAGVRLFRVHDVLANRQAADVAFAIMASKK